MRLTTYLSDGNPRKILSVESVEEAREILQARTGCQELHQLQNGEIVEFYDPNREPNLWAQGYDTDHLGGLVGVLETKWHYVPQVEPESAS